MHFQCWLSLNNLVGHFLVIVGFCILSGSCLNSMRGVLACCAPGVVWPINSSHQRWTEASIKKHRASLLWGVVWAIFPLHYMCGECVWVCACLWWVIEPRFFFTLCRRQALTVTLNYCFPNTRESMWNGFKSVHKDESSRLCMTSNISNEFTLVTVGEVTLHEWLSGFCQI